MSHLLVTGQIVLGDKSVLPQIPMQLLDLTLPTPAENLALEEALLLEAEEGRGPDEVLRIWEAQEPMIVMGRSGKLEREVDAGECRRRGVPVFRRASGGGTVVLGPGCLGYAVVVPYSRHAHLRMLDEAHAFVLEKLAAALRALAPGVARHGISDLTFESEGLRKFSGNSLRCRREHFLYHGTILYDFDLSLLDSLLQHPPREPDYRAGRAHGEFIANLALPREKVRSAIRSAFGDPPEVTDWPAARVAELARSYPNLLGD